ncbi:ABC transporter substrate-binding protein [Pseudonocardia petroleophila]|uniref:ABC transporter substrate-binding protein n=1 Tax=Pseudonocardia petroleophila TaxID=37331 RepID=A0A7G7MK11_9PSEU|nr:ABC transporter substrate-binding protein [Pseudonocardia petroleophila]QNG53122.1 ABC transporter substrate-binding protein [Pseudonocardia petroleophila]
MRSRRVAASLAVGVSVALFASACGGGGGDSAGGAGGDGAATTISVYSTEPENPLVPSNTNEVGGGRVIDALFSYLVGYEAEDAAPYNDVAESIETTDSQNYTITLKDWTFHDGTPVTSSSFVDAWNFAAYGPNAQQNSSFFSQIQGFADVNPTDPDGESGPAEAPAPAAETMSGLQVVDDKTFTVALTAPFSVFPTTLGYSAFAPLPESFFTDQAAFEAAPIGNGPFRYVDRQPGANITVETWADFPGERKPQVGGVEFRSYASPEAGYADLVAGNLDYMEQLPPSALVGRLFEQDLAGRNSNTTYLGMNTIAFPIYDPKYADPRVRVALSMAIDRQAVSDQVYDGLRDPAAGIVPPGLDGYVDGQCGENCTYNPDRAKQLLAEAGFTGPIELTSNADGAGNQEVFQAFCISITNATGLECNFVPVPTFAEFRTTINAREATTPFRTGWSADYPSIENFLNPLYRTGASANDGEYSNPQVDALLAQGDAAPSPDAAFGFYQEAERLILQDMPTIPTFYSNTQAGWSPRMSTATTNQFRELDLITAAVSE